MKLCFLILAIEDNFQYHFTFDKVADGKIKETYTNGEILFDQNHMKLTYGVVNSAVCFTNDNDIDLQLGTAPCDANGPLCPISFWLKYHCQGATPKPLLLSKHFHIFCSRFNSSYSSVSYLDIILDQKSYRLQVGSGFWYHFRFYKTLNKLLFLVNDKEVSATQLTDEGPNEGYERTNANLLVGHSVKLCLDDFIVAMDSTLPLSYFDTYKNGTYILKC